MEDNKIMAHIPFAGLLNARHLGGYPIPDGVTREDAYIRCESPERVTPRDLDQLKERGIDTVIDLRSAEEVTAAPNPMAEDGRFIYHNIPVFQTDASPEALTRSGIPMGDLYIYMLDHCRPAFREIFTVILHAPGGVLFHCSAGKDRTGVLAALLLLSAGVEEETVVTEYGYTQTLLAPLLEKLRQNLPEGVSEQYMEDMLAARPEYLKTALRHLGKVYHGAAGYMTALGFSGREISALNRRLTRENQNQEESKGA